jgi:hypothetical protein
LRGAADRGSGGEIVYYDFGSDEMELRKVIAGLGPEFASNR